MYARRLKLGITVLLALIAVLGGVWLLQSSSWSVSRLLNWVEAAGPVPFFTAQALLPVIGVAVSPFLLVSGATFGLAMSLIGTAVAQAVSLLLTYWIATRWLKRVLQKWILNKQGMRSFLDRKDPVVTALLVSAMPGPSNCIKSYIMAVTGIPLKYYMPIAWPIMMGYDTLTIVLGENILTGDWRGGLAAFLLIFVVGLGSRWIWKHFAQKKAAATTAPPAKVK